MDDEVEALSAFLDHLGSRLGGVEASLLSERGEAAQGTDARAAGEPADDTASAADDALLPADRSDGEWNTAAVGTPLVLAGAARTDVVTRLRAVIDDDGRRRRPGCAPPSWPSSMAEEYSSLFENLADAQFVKALVRLQSWWRTMRRQSRLRRWKTTRTRRKRLHFRAWKSVTNAQTFFDGMLCKWIWRGWKLVVVDQKSIRKVSWQVFKSRVGRKTLSITAVNLFFSEDADPPDASSYNALRLGVRRQILQLLMDSWRQELKYWQKCRVAAMVMMQRALRRTEAARPHWTPELISLVFHMWQRSLAYKRRFKANERLPKFPAPDIPEWDEWVHRYTSRQLLKQKVQKRGTRVFKLNRLRRWRWYTRYMRGIADRLALAKQHFEKALLLTIMGSWLNYCRSRGRILRRRGRYFGAWKDWAPRKKRLRQLKQLLTLKANKNAAKRGMQRWSLCMNNVRLLYAFQHRRLSDRDMFYPAMSAAYALSGLTANFVVLSCFRNWQLLRTRRVTWHGFYYLHQRNKALHLLSTVFHAWQHCLSKWKSSRDELSLEPALILDRGRATVRRLHEGYRPELFLPRTAVKRLLPVATKEPVLPKPKPRFTDLERKLSDAICACDDASVEDALEEGARVDVVDERGRSPLHHACSYFTDRYLKIIALLLHCGADVECRDDNGDRPIDLATNAQAAALLHTHSTRLAKALTPSELTGCMQLMTLEWNELGGIALWRFVVHELVNIKHRELEMAQHAHTHSPNKAAKDEPLDSGMFAPVRHVAVAELMGKKRLERLFKTMTFLHKSQRSPSEREVSKVGDYSGTMRSMDDDSKLDMFDAKPPERSLSFNGIHDNDENDEDPMVVRRRHVRCADFWQF